MVEKKGDMGIMVAIGGDLLEMGAEFLGLGKANQASGAIVVVSKLGLG